GGLHYQSDGTVEFRKGSQEGPDDGERILALRKGVVVEREHEIEDVRIQPEAVPAVLRQVGHWVDNLQAGRHDYDRAVEEVANCRGRECVWRPHLVDPVHAVVLPPDHWTFGKLPIGPEDVVAAVKMIFADMPEDPRQLCWGDLNDVDVVGCDLVVPLRHGRDG